MAGRKTLIILRHAKAETGSASQDDHERGLNDIGVAACAIVGKYIAGQRISPDTVLCSTALRARATWALVKKAAGIGPPEEFTDRLYLASANETLNLLAALPETARSVMLVGHNPGFHQLCLTLARKGDEALLDRLVLKFPTCALAVIELGEGEWKDVAQAQSALQSFVTPKMLGA